MAPKHLSTVERQILTNQYRILALTASDAKSKKRYERNRAILEEGVTGLYHIIFDLPEEADPEVAAEVHQILTTFKNLQELLDTLEKADKEELDMDLFRFKGFAPDSPHHGYLKFAAEHTELGKSISKRAITASGEDPLYRYRQIVQYEDRAIRRIGYLRKKDLKNILDLV